MNIIINNYCNLKCRYCFANDFLKRSDQREMSLSTFEYILNWLKKNGNTKVNLLGGEPTMHPLFKDFVAKVVLDGSFSHLHIFSNCNFDVETLDLILLWKDLFNITILPNVNEKEVLGTDWDRTIFNLTHLKKKGIIDTLGINIYSPDMDFSYIFKLAKELGIEKIRWAITIPNNTLDESFDYEKYMSPFMPLLTDFYKMSIQYGIKLLRDCNNLPTCLIPNDLLRMMAMTSPEDLHYTSCSCMPVLDIDYKLNVFRCFGFSEYLSVKLSSFETMDELFKYFIGSYEDFTHRPLMKRCEECPKYKRNNNTSCGCAKYRVKPGDKLSDIVTEVKT